ncbi:MAG: hypothetical protein M3506_10100, partial [Chloroflexota bacterium]|nr:hypothetical protein [Chloroflexota bacterium]
YTNLLLHQLQEYGAQRNYHFDLDATGLRLADDLPGGAARGVRISQTDEIAAVAQEFIDAERTESARVLWAAARDALLAQYE